MEDKGKREGWREVRRALFGLTAAFLIVGFFAGLIFYFIPNFFNSSGPDWTIVENESISVYYLKEDIPDLNQGKLLTELSKSRNRIIDELALSEAKIPDRIRVYFHKDPPALKSAISARKSSSGSDVPLGVMDVIYGYGYKPVLVRLLTQFAWGRPSAEFLRLGLQTYISDQLNRIHLRAAGLDRSGFSFDEIISLENTGHMPQSFQVKIYDSFDSPAAPAGMSLSSFSSLMRSNTRESPHRYELEVEAGSFVSYLISEYGPDKFRELWKAGSLSSGAEKVYGVELEELEEDWREFVESKAGTDKYIRYFRARTAFSSGKFEEALANLEDSFAGGLYDEKLHFLKGRIYFYLGEWGKAQRQFSELEEGEHVSHPQKATRAYKNLLRVYKAGEKFRKGKITIFVPEGVDLSRETLLAGDEVLVKAQRHLSELEWSSGRFRTFILRSEGEIVESWMAIDLPGSVAVVSDPDKFRLRIAEMLVSRMSRTPTYSNLLRRGLVHYLAKEKVFSSGKKVLREDGWKPLSEVLVTLDPGSNSSKIAASFVGYLLHRYGAKDFRTIWQLTTPLGGDNSLGSALEKVAGLRLNELEKKLKSFLRSYEN